MKFPRPSTRPQPASHREVARYQVVAQLGHLALGHRTAAIHDHEALADSAGEGQLLFDEQNGKLLFRVQLDQDIGNLADDVGLNTLGGLV